MLVTKKRTLCILMALVLILGSCSLAFAAENEGGIQTRSVYSCLITTDRLSNTSAESIIDAAFADIASTATGTLTLMEYSNGSTFDATGVSPTVQSKTVNNRGSLYMVNNWNLQKGKVYRLKIVIKDKIGTTTYTDTYWSNPF